MTDPFDDPFDAEIVRALRGPATPGETADEDHYRAMFRETRGGGKVVPLVPGSSRRGRTVRTFGAGTTLSVVLAVAAGGGVAAAYTNHLPEPIQSFAHQVGRPLGVPGTSERHRTTPRPRSRRADHHARGDPGRGLIRRRADPQRRAVEGRRRQAEPAGRAVRDDVRRGDSRQRADAQLDAHPTPRRPRPHADSHADPDPRRRHRPSRSTPPAPVAASLGISGSSHSVGYGESPTFSGVVRTDEGAGIPGVRVALMQRTDGTWSRVAFATTDEDGGVSLTAPPVHETVGLRLKTKGARSEAWRVTMQPTLNLSSSVLGDTVTITASAVGGQPGDVVRLGTRRGGQAVVLATGILGPDGTVTFQVEQTTRKARYGALLERSDDHTADRESITVIKPKTTKDGEQPDDPSPSPSG